MLLFNIETPRKQQTRNLTKESAAYML